MAKTITRNRITVSAGRVTSTTTFTKVDESEVFIHHKKVNQMSKRTKQLKGSYMWKQLYLWEDNRAV
jgi:hypothetical protein